MGPYRPERDAEALGDLLIGQAGCGKAKDLGLAGGDPAAPQVGLTVSSLRATTSATAHRFITRSVETNRATLSYAYP